MCTCLQDLISELTDEQQFGKRGEVWFFAQVATFIFVLLPPFGLKVSIPVPDVHEQLWVSPYEAVGCEAPFRAWAGPWQSAWTTAILNIGQWSRQQDANYMSGKGIEKPIQSSR